MSTTISSADEKNVMPNMHVDVESNDEKATSGAVSQEPTYDNQGTDVERALIFKQDLRIIPLCSVSSHTQITQTNNANTKQFIYLLCYLDRSNIGNAKVSFINLPQQYQNPLILTRAKGPEPRRRQRPPHGNEHDQPAIHNRPHGLPHRLRPLRSSEQLHAQAPEAE